MNYDWQQLAEAARRNGLGHGRPGDVAAIYGVTRALEHLPLERGALEQVRAYLTESLRFRELSKRAPTAVYLTFFGGDHGSEYLKVGVSGKLVHRMASIRTSNPMAQLWTWAALAPSRSAAFRIEKGILDRLGDSRASGEWVRACCATEAVASAVVESIGEMVAEIGVSDVTSFAKVEV